MATFDLESFLVCPSHEQLVQCHRDDLYEISQHFSLAVNKQLLKKELSAFVVDELVRKGLLVLAASAELTVSEVLTEDTLGQRQEAEFMFTQEKSGDSEGGESGKAPLTPPRRCPTSPACSTDSQRGSKLQVRLARLQLEAKDREQDKQHRFQLELRKLEMDKEKEVRVRQMELDSELRASGAFGRARESSPGNPHPPAFNVGTNVSLVPIFREAEVDAYFGAFERMAAALQWPANAWALLIQCKLHGRAQEAVAALSIEDSLNYDLVKHAILRVYELVPEAYRQKFRNHRKGANQTHVEYAREKGMLLNKWIESCDAAEYSALKESILMEEFKRGLPDRIVGHINDQKVHSLSAAAVLADEYVLMHKTVFSPAIAENSRRMPGAPVGQPARVFTRNREERECHYCHQPGHLIGNYMLLKRKEQPPNMTRPKGIGLINTRSLSISTTDNEEEIDPCFKPFVFEGLISLTGESDDQRPVRILRDTGGSQSVIVASALPFSDKSACGYGSLLCGIEMGYVPRPVHNVHIQSKLITGFFPVAVCPALPIRGIVLLMGNDIAGGKITPALEILNSPQTVLSEATNAHIFPNCAVTRTQAHKSDSEVSLNDTMFGTLFTDEKMPEEKPAAAIRRL
ncbi:hypothetical protein CesoFtcFv8_014277 [Champsocephalus esox]|uniref:SCAN box domain-containing protein n=1 Tax=Champsocephalus esox TaxID=159716 RepID=A0AAN8BS79_9TELE|nr:hypothetical protein CesoFtcFv8_014277 [Champsocephalus esox]